MFDVLFRTRALLARPAVRVWWAGLALAGLGLTFLPLCDVPGYELATALGLLQALGGGGLAVAGGRASRPGEPPPIAPVALLLAAAWLPAVGLAVARTSLWSPCDPLAGAGFLPVLVLPGTWLVAAAGLLVSRATKRLAASVAAWLGLVLLSAAHTLWPVYFGAQVFAYNHLAGFLPGPLYDEALAMPPALFWFRLGTLLLAGAFTAALLRRWALAAVALAACLALEAQGARLGFRMTPEALAEALGGVVETEAFVLHHPRGLSREEVARLEGDVRFRLAQLVDFFGEAPPGRVQVWWYRTAEEKQRLVGAAATQFAAPWRREVHVHGVAVPHPVLKHELVHALAGAWGSPPFGVPAALGGLLPHVGVIEGFAVAADDPVDELSLHEWAAAMRQKGLLPDVRALMTTQGFYGAPASRAYTTAGSFLRWLGDTHGKAALRALYRDGDFQRATGQPLQRLATAWEAFLDAVPLDPSAVNLAFARFRRGSLFDRPCAREVARLSRDAQAAAEEDPAEALALLRRCRARQPDEPAHALAEAATLRRLGREAEAVVLLDALLTRLEPEPAAWGDAALARADLAEALGDGALAQRLWERVLSGAPPPALERTARVRLLASHLPAPARAAVQAHFTPGDDEVKTYRLQRALELAPDALVLHYLLGRRLQQAGAPAEALPHLERALAPDAPPAIAREATRLALEAAFALRQCARLEALAAPGRFGPTFDARARDWVARCAFAAGSPHGT